MLFFTVLLCVHAGHSVASALLRRSGREPNKAARIFPIALQTILFCIGAYYAYDQGIISRRLLSPVLIGFGLLGGHMIFGLSLLVTHQSIEDTWGHFFNVPAIWRFMVEQPYVLTRFAFVGVSEEVIWRAAALPPAVELMGTIPALALVSVGFCVVHEHFFKNAPIVSMEFLFFALLVGALYIWTASLILIILIHALRDIEIAYIEYIIKVQELGDEEQAAREIEKDYMPRLREGRES